MPRYSMTFQGFVTNTAGKTMFVVHASNVGTYCEIQEVHLFGAGTSAAADTQHRGSLERLDVTSAGTLTARTPERFDPVSRASQIIGAVNYTVEPTAYQGNPLLMMSFNQRGKAQWAVPKGMGYFVYNATGEVKRGVRLISSVAGQVDGTLTWEEP